jgi:hypothetical protein
VNDRIVIASLDREFARLHSNYCSLIRATPEEDLYRQPQRSSGALSSLAENVLRGAAVVEQSFGGITANLWDHPFEWTLPENLSTAARLVEYLAEVEATRQRAFASFARDEDLSKEIMVPGARTRALIELLIETLVQSAVFYGQAIGTLNLLNHSSPS